MLRNTHRKFYGSLDWVFPVAVTVKILCLVVNKWPALHRIVLPQQFPAHYFWCSGKCFALFTRLRRVKTALFGVYTVQWLLVEPLFVSFGKTLYFIARIVYKNNLTLVLTFSSWSFVEWGLVGFYFKTSHFFHPSLLIYEYFAVISWKCFQ